MSISHNFAIQKEKICLNISHNLKYRRNIVGLTQTELGLKIGVTQVMIAKLETNKSKLNIFQLVNICHALNCTPNDILGFNEDAGEPEENESEEKEK